MGPWLIMAVNAALFGGSCFVVASLITQIGAETLEQFALALLIGPFQFWTDKLGRRRAWHKLMGRVYVACCLLSATCAPSRSVTAVTTA